MNLPDYFRMDAGVFWEKDKMRVALNVFNVLDKYLYSGSYYDYLSAFYWQTEPPRNFRMSIGYRF
jgi:iron complex outermembrane receptor protein